MSNPVIAMAAAVVSFAVLGSSPVLAQDDCGRMHHRVMGAYQAQSPHYAQMRDHYNARCLSGSSQRTWGRDDHHQYDNDRHYGYGDNQWGRGR